MIAGFFHSLLDIGQLLDAGYIKDSRVLICPTQKTEPPLNSNDIRKGQCGYLYWGNNISDMNPETIIACTKPGLLSMPAIFKKGFLNVPWNLRTIGGDNYVNVLYLDGHASGFLKPPDDLEIITEKINPLKSHSTYSP